MPFVDGDGSELGVIGRGGGGGPGYLSSLNPGFGMSGFGPLAQMSAYAKRRAAGTGMAMSPATQPAGLSFGQQGGNPFLSHFMGQGGFGQGFGQQGGGGGGGGPDVIGGSWQGSLARLLNPGQQAGFMDPMGSQGLISLLSQQMSGQAAASEQAARGEAEQRFADNPAAAAWAGINAGINTRSGLARGLQGIQAQSAMQNQDFLRQLYGQWLGTHLQGDLQTGARNAQGPMGQIGSALGSIAGSVIPGLGGLFGGHGGGVSGAIGEMQRNPNWQPEPMMPRGGRW